MAILLVSLPITSLMFYRTIKHFYAIRAFRWTQFSAHIAIILRHTIRLLLLLLLMLFRWHIARQPKIDSRVRWNHKKRNKFFVSFGFIWNSNRLSSNLKLTERGRLRWPVNTCVRKHSPITDAAISLFFFFAFVSPTAREFVSNHENFHRITWRRATRASRKWTVHSFVGSDNEHAYSAKRRDKNK